MREPLYKAQSIDTGEWITGQVVKFYDCDRGYYWSMSKPSQAFIDVNPDSLCESTGEFDKLKARIWEDDLVKLDTWEGIFQIKFIEGAFCLAFIEGEFKGEYAADLYYINHAGIPQCTVIRSIHDKIKGNNGT